MAWLGLSANVGHSKAVVQLPVPYFAQPNDQTCLPTSLMMAVHYLGRMDLSTTRVHSLQTVCQYDRYNTSKLVEECGLYGFPNFYNYAWTRDTVENELREGRPVVLGTNLGRVGHFVLAVGYTDDGRVIIHDPWHKEHGWPFGGPNVVADWDRLLWRGGIIVRPEAFPEPPAISGTMVDDRNQPVEDVTVTPGRMTPGDTAEVLFRVKNNGRAPWPDNVLLCPVDVDSSPTRARDSGFHVPGEWVSPSRIMQPDKRNLAPGDIATFRFHLRAPDVPKATTFKEFWNLMDGTGRWFSESWLAGPGNQQMSSAVAVIPKRSWTIPLVDAYKPGMQPLPWSVKFGSVQVDTATSIPDGSTVFRLFAPESSCNTAAVGDWHWTNYRAEAQIYCDYRPELKSRGFERVGIFVHDNGQHAAEGKNMVERGACYALVYDSDDGTVRCGSIDNGVYMDFHRNSRVKLPKSGWHTLAIRCEGTKLNYALDGKLIDTVNDGTLKDGECGVYYRSAFDNPADTRGILFSGFRVDP